MFHVATHCRLCELHRAAEITDLHLDDELSVFQVSDLPSYKSNRENMSSIVGMINHQP